MAFSGTVISTVGLKDLKAISLESGLFFTPFHSNMLKRIALPSLIAGDYVDGCGNSVVLKCRSGSDVDTALENI